MANKEAEKILKDDLGVKSLRSFPKNINVHYYNDSEYISDEEQDSSKDGDYILEGSDSRYITEKEVENLSEAERRLAKNEIYARHGRMFDSADLQDYFESKSWYKGTVKPSDFDLTNMKKLILI